MIHSVTGVNEESGYYEDGSPTLGQQDLLLHSQCELSHYKHCSVLFHDHKASEYNDH